jgi:4-amino-4-deoxy-L-arabinose transferase-like glycosyltransferase
LLAALAGWAAIAVLALVVGAPLGHDEAQYALAARGEVPGGTWLYLSPGTSAIARVGLALDGEPWLVRLPFVLLGIGVPLATWALGRTAFDDRTGAWAAAVIAGAPHFALHNADVLSDLPAAACVVAGITVIARELSREEGPSWWLVAAAPAWAAGFYIRYGHAPVLAIAGLLACVLWWRRLLARPLPVLVTVVTFGALLVPHALHSLDKTGTVLGVLRHSSAAPAEAYVGEGLVDYVTSNPFWFYGFVVAPVIVVGLVSIASRDQRWRMRVFLGGIAIGQVVMIGLQTRAQPRYVYIAVMLLAVLGVAAIGKLAARMPRLPRALPYVVVAAAWLYVAVRVIPTHEHRAHARAHLVAASETIMRDTGHRPCLVLTRQVPQIGMFTRCEPALSREPYPPWPRDRRIYVIATADNVLDVVVLLRAMGGVATLLPVSDPRARVWHVDPFAR